MHGTAPRRPLDAADGPDERDCSAEPWRGPDGSHRRDWSTGSRPTHTCSQVVPKLIEGALEGTSSEVPLANHTGSPALQTPSGRE